MKTSLANKILRVLVDLDEDTEAQLIPRLATMAELKWDTYEGFRAGQRFMESLARWLQGFPDRESRLRWINFLINDLIFVSAAEVEHLIAVAYPDVIRPAVLERAATSSKIDRHRKSTLIGSPAFLVEQRRILVLALSDGARLDALRRSSALSHEQFVPQLEVPEARRSDLSDKLKTAVALHGGQDSETTFNHVLLVDDFYGSGTSLIKEIVESDDDRVPGSPRIGGKAGKFIEHAESLTRSEANEPVLLDPDYTVTILLYMASAQAQRHIERTITALGLENQWTLEVVQVFDDNCKVTDPALLADCDEFWDPVLEDEHKKCAARGYKNCALPVVLYHNGPNNSVSPLWADSVGRRRDDVVSKDRRALFPRYERHHSDRP